jgi:hypothetical protein
VDGPGFPSDLNEQKLAEKLDIPINVVTAGAFHSSTVRRMQCGVQSNAIAHAIDIVEAIPAASQARVRASAASELGARLCVPSRAADELVHVWHGTTDNAERKNMNQFITKLEGSVRGCKGIILWTASIEKHFHPMHADAGALNQCRLTLLKSESGAI